MSVCKKIMILLFSSFVGIIANPEMPFASDTVVLTDISGAVQTVEVEPAVDTGDTSVVLTKEESETIITQPAYIEPAAPVYVEPAAPVYVEPAAPVYVEPAAPVVVTPPDNINIAGRSIEMVTVANTAVDAGNHVNKYSNKFLYGHNSASVFGVLYNVREGDTFSVTENGVTKNYVVKVVAIYEKADDYTLRLNGQDIKMSVVAKARYSGVSYDLSLMTCYGTSYGNGDASHRLVLFASEI